MPKWIYFDIIIRSGKSEGVCYTAGCCICFDTKEKGKCQNVQAVDRFCAKFDNWVEGEILK